MTSDAYGRMIKLIIPDACGRIPPLILSSAYRGMLTLIISSDCKRMPMSVISGASCLIDQSSDINGELYIFY